MGLIDAFNTGYDQSFSGADLIIVATPVKIIASHICEMLPHVKPGAIVTDVGSVKAAVVEQIEPHVPQGVFFIGGHPIAGTENSGFEASVSGLFENRVCVLTPTHSTDPHALARLKRFWESVGSRVVMMDITTHDRIFAGISHLPHMVAFSLVNAVTDMEDFEKQILQYSAGGFRDFTRIAASDPAMWRDIALMNRDNILNAIDFFEKSLSALKDSIGAGDAACIETFFKKSHDTRRAI